MKTFIVEFLSKIFEILAKISIFHLVCWLASKKSIKLKEENGGFVDIWVLGNFVLSLVLLILFSTNSFLKISLIEAIFIGYGVERVLEMIIYQINVLMFDAYRKRKEELEKKRKGITYIPYALRGYRRILILLLYNYFEIIFWFSSFYFYFDSSLINNSNIPILSALNLSFYAMTTFGVQAVTPNSDFGIIITLIQSVIGLFMTLLILSRFVSLIPNPKSIDEFEN